MIRGIGAQRERTRFFRAARGFGASGGYLLAGHILPETSGVLLTQAAILVPAVCARGNDVVIFGIGRPEPVPELGNMLASLQHYNVWSRIGGCTYLRWQWCRSSGYLVLASLLQQRSRTAKIEEARSGV